MKKSNIVASCLLGIGVVLMLGSLVSCKGVENLRDTKYTTKTYEITENIQNIAIQTIIADVKILPAPDGISKVVSFEKENLKQTVTASDGTLTIGLEDTRKWYDHINLFDWRTPTVTVYLAQTEWNTLSLSGGTGDVNIAKEFFFESIDVSNRTGNVRCYASTSGLMKIKTSTGNITVENVTVGVLDLTLSTGDVEVENVVCAGDVQMILSTGDTEIENLTCKNLTAKASTGELEMKNVIAQEKINIEISTGDVDFEKCDAAELYIKIGTGDVEGTLLSEKIFVVDTNTGRKRVPSTTTGGKCEIKTSTGDIEIQIVAQ